MVLAGVTVVLPFEVVVVVQPLLLLPTQVVLWVFVKTWAFDGAADTTRSSRMGSAEKIDFVMIEAGSLSNRCRYF